MGMVGQISYQTSIRVVIRVICKVIHCLMTCTCSTFIKQVLTDLATKILYFSFIAECLSTRHWIARSGQDRLQAYVCMYVSHFWNAINLTWRHMCLVKIARKRVNLYLVDSHVFMCLHAVTGWRRRDGWWAYLRAKVILRWKYLAAIIVSV